MNQSNSSTTQASGSSFSGSSSPISTYTVLTALLCNFATVGAGVNAQSAIVIQCMCGRSYDKYFLFRGSVRLEDRYSGMKDAFGDDKELFIPYRLGEVVYHPPLNTEDYNHLLISADCKSKVQQTGANKSWVSEGMTFPVWRWLFSRYHRLLAILLSVLAFVPSVIIAMASLVAGVSWIAAIVHGTIASFIAAYDGALLDIQREVTYLRVKATSVSPEHAATWTLLHEGAPETPPRSASEAVQDLVTGGVRKSDDDLYIPVLALEPSVGFNAAAWALAVTDARAPLLAISATLVLDAHYRWVVAYGLVCFAQACLQSTLAMSFCSITAPYEVMWFRRLSNHLYAEEHVDFKMLLQ